MRVAVDRHLQLAHAAAVRRPVAVTVVRGQVESDGPSDRPGRGQRQERRHDPHAPEAMPHQGSMGEAPEGVKASALRRGMLSAPTPPDG
jgi:hypothetical protein